MLMFGILAATDVRRNWSEFIDSVIHDKPKVVKRNRDLFISFSITQLMDFLEPYKFNVKYFSEDDGTITATLNEFDIVVNSKDKNSAKVALAKELIEYSQEYFDEFQLYYHTPNRRSHFPYVVKVLVQKDLDSVVRLINA